MLFLLIITTLKIYYDIIYSVTNINIKYILNYINFVTFSFQYIYNIVIVPYY